MRTFVCTEGGSDKFWHIALEGSAFTVHFGRTGSQGQRQRKEFENEQDALREHDRLIRQKLKGGYQETTATGPGDLRQALEQAILDHPEDRAAHAAYADLLMEQGDPQGEFIQVQLALEDESLPEAERKRLKRREQTLLRAHQAAWVGDWATEAYSTGPEGRGQVHFASRKPFRFIRGILAEVTLDEMNLACARAFVRSPQTRLVRRLFLGGFAYEDEYEAEETIHTQDADYPARSVFARWPHFASLRTFQYGWTSNEVYGDFCHFQCHEWGLHTVSMVRRMPRLEELYLFVSEVEVGKLFALDTLTNLRVLQVYHSYPYPVEKLAANPAVRNLTHLLLHPKAQGSWSWTAPYITLKGVKALLQAPHLSNLQHLRLRLTKLGDEGCEEIVRSGILRRLKTLDLRHGCISERGAQILAACPDLKNLEQLDVSRNELTRQGIQALQAVGIPLLTQHQHDSTVGEDNPEYLYEGDYE